MVGKRMSKPRDSELRLLACEIARRALYRLLTSGPLEEIYVFERTKLIPSDLDPGEYEEFKRIFDEECIDHIRKKEKMILNQVKKHKIGRQRLERREKVL